MAKSLGDWTGADEDDDAAAWADDDDNDNDHDHDDGDSDNTKNSHHDGVVVGSSGHGEGGGGRGGLGDDAIVSDLDIAVEEGGGSSVALALTEGGVNQAATEAQSLGDVAGVDLLPPPSFLPSLDPLGAARREASRRFGARTEALAGPAPAPARPWSSLGPATLGWRGLEGGGGGGSGAPDLRAGVSNFGGGWAGSSVASDRAGLAPTGPVPGDALAESTWVISEAEAVRYFS